MNDKFKALSISKTKLGATPSIEKQKAFQDELIQLINRYSRESFSNTADFILADIMLSALVAYEKAIIEQERIERNESGK